MCNINHPKFPCRICAKNVHDKDEAIKCDLCKLWIHISDVSRDFLGRPISAVSLWVESGGAVILPYGGSDNKASRSSKDLVCWNHLLLIEIHPPQHNL